MSFLLWGLVLVCCSVVCVPGVGWGGGTAVPGFSCLYPSLGLFLYARVTDEVFNFLLVWYYCTLTIRESILISNGSR